MLVPLVLACDASDRGIGLDAEYAEVEQTFTYRTVNSMSLESLFPAGPAVTMAKYVQANDLDGIARRVEDGADVNGVGNRGATPLFWAMRTGAKESFVCLLRLGANPNTAIDGDTGLLHMAVSNPDSFYLITLLDFGADPNMIEPGGLGLTPLFYTFNTSGRAGELSRVAMLVEAGAEVDQRSGQGAVPILNAAASIRYDIVFYLIQQGAESTAHERKGRDLEFYTRYHDGALRSDAPQRYWLNMVKEAIQPSG